MSSFHFNTFLTLNWWLKMIYQSWVIWDGWKWLHQFKVFFEILIYDTSHLIIQSDFENVTNNLKHLNVSYFRFEIFFSKV